MSEWKTYRLGKFADINPKVQMKQGGEYSFVEMKDLNSTLKFVLPSAKRELKGGSKFQNGDTLFARITPCLENGKICQVKGLEDEIGFGSTEFLVFRGKKDISDTDFVYYLTRTEFVRNNAVQMMTGTSGRQRVEKSALEELEILAPENIHTQQQIATILTSLDDKIELNLQMNQTLEAMAQAIFKDWFVNFNFPGFDGELVDGLPKGWSYKMIKYLGKVVTGNTPSSKNPEYFGDVIPFVTPTDFKNFGKLIIGATRYLSDDGRQAMKTRLLPKHSIVVTCIGSDMGKVAINCLECITNQQINSIILGDKNFVDYLYYDLVYKYDYLRNIATGGSTMPIINKSRFEEIEILIPDSNVLENFQVIMDSFNSKIEENIRQTESLTQIRDSLLPKLMTGKIEIQA